MSASRAAVWSPDMISGALIPILLILIGVPAVLWHAWVLTKLWNWYIVTGFGLADLHMIHAYGLALVVGLLKSRPHGNDKREWYVQLAMPFLAPAVSLALGWVGSFWL